MDSLFNMNVFLFLHGLYHIGCAFSILFLSNLPLCFSFLGRIHHSNFKYNLPHTTLRFLAYSILLHGLIKLSCSMSTKPVVFMIASVSYLTEMICLFIELSQGNMHLFPTILSILISALCFYVVYPFDSVLFQK